MPPSAKKVYKIGNKKIITFDLYNEKDLTEISEEFRKNRSFNSWRDVFHESLKSQRQNWWGKNKRTYNELANRFPYKIVQTFFELLIIDLIEKETEFVFNPKAKSENQLLLKMGYIVKVPKKSFMKKTALVFPYAGTHYMLKFNYPKNWKNSQIPRRACFYRTYRKRVWDQLNRGRRYYNSMKEKIFSNL